MEPPVQPVESSSPQETRQWAEAVARKLPEGSLVLLDGPMGAGKTTMTRGLVSGLGGEPRQVTSPTYVLVKRYETPAGWVHHLDAYRLPEGPDGAEQLEALGFVDLVAASRLTILEWPSRVAGELSELACPVYRVTIEVTGEETRRLSVARV